LDLLLDTNKLSDGFKKVNSSLRKLDRTNEIGFEITQEVEEPKNKKRKNKSRSRNSFIDSFLEGEDAEEYADLEDYIVCKKKGRNYQDLFD